jgi:hypothetical protein
MMTENETDFELVEPFNAGDLLDDLSAEQAFALGIEWQMLRERLKMGQPFSTLCLAVNASWLVKLAEGQRRLVEIRLTPWEAWTELSVGDLILGNN